MAKAVVSTIGPDRPGLVSDITAIAARLSLNIEDSRMAVLGGEFAVLMALEGEQAALQDFDAALAKLCEQNQLAYLVRPTATRSLSTTLRPYTATVVALDHPGIVHSIAEFFSSRGINICDLRTDTSPAAHTGTPIFNVCLTIELAGTVRIHALKEAFDAFCASADLDGHLEASR